jgi:hypothetical protein
MYRPPITLTKVRSPDFTLASRKRRFKQFFLSSLGVLQDLSAETAQTAHCHPAQQTPNGRSGPLQRLRSIVKTILIALGDQLLCSFAQLSGRNEWQRRAAGLR